MAVVTISGKLTDFGRAPFPAGASVELYVEPVRPAIGPSGIYADARIPVTVSGNGNWTAQLEESSSLRPPAQYLFVARWLDGDHWKDWARWLFTVPKGGGSIEELGATNVGIDEDDVPFFDPGNWENKLIRDTDGVPYVSIGA